MALAVLLDLHGEIGLEANLPDGAHACFKPINMRVDFLDHVFKHVAGSLLWIHGHIGVDERVDQVFDSGLEDMDVLVSLDADHILSHP